MSDQWTELERLSFAMERAHANYEASDGSDNALFRGSNDAYLEFHRALRAPVVRELITAARASSVGTNGEAGSEQKPDLIAVLETISKGGPDIGPVTKQTFQHGFDQGCAWAGRVARSALSRQAQTGNGEGGA